jgi:hypothetical protein
LQGLRNHQHAVGESKKINYSNMKHLNLLKFAILIVCIIACGKITENETPPKEDKEIIGENSIPTDSSTTTTDSTIVADTTSISDTSAVDTNQSIEKTPTEILTAVELFPKSGSTITISEARMVIVPVVVKFSHKVRAFKLSIKEIEAKKHKLFGANLKFIIATETDGSLLEKINNSEYYGALYDRFARPQKNVFKIDEEDSTKVRFNLLYSLENFYKKMGDGLIGFTIPAGVLQYQIDGISYENDVIELDYYLKLRRDNTPQTTILNNYMETNSDHILLELDGDYDVKSAQIELTKPSENNAFETYSLNADGVKVQKLQKWSKKLTLFNSKIEYIKNVTKIKIPKNQFTGKYHLEFTKGVKIESIDYDFKDGNTNYKINNLYNKDLIPTSKNLYIDVKKGAVSYKLTPSDDIENLKGKTLAGRFDNFTIELTEPILEDGIIEFTEKEYSGNVKYKISDLISNHYYNVAKNIITIPLNSFRNNRTIKELELKFQNVRDFGNNQIVIPVKTVSYSNGSDINLKVDANTNEFSRLEDKTINGKKYFVYRYNFNFKLSDTCSAIYANTNSSIICISDWFKLADFFYINKLTKVNNKKSSFYVHSGLKLNMWNLDNNYIDLYTTKELPEKSSSISMQFNALKTNKDNPYIAN